MSSARKRRSRTRRFTGDCLALVLVLVLLLVSACGSHGTTGHRPGTGTAPRSSTATDQTPASSPSATAYCRRFDTAVASQAPGFTLAPALSVYAPGDDPGVGGTVGTNLKRLTTGSYTCQWRTGSADIQVGVFVLHTPIDEAGWESANQIDASTATSLTGVGDWAYTQSGTSAIVAGVGESVLFVDTDGAPQVNGENLADGLVPVLR